MVEVTAGEPDERVLGRRWTVRLDAVGRGSTAVRVSCSRPSCAEQRLPSAAVGRAAAIAHLKAHLRAAAGPRAQAYCACRTASCHTHIASTDGRARAEPWRCGGAVVLAVLTDREGRWWQAMECCSRCAAARRWALRWAIAAARPTAADGSRCSGQEGRLQETRTAVLPRPTASRRTVHLRPSTRSSGSPAVTSTISCSRLPFHVPAAAPAAPWTRCAATGLTVCGERPL